MFRITVMPTKKIPVRSVKTRPPRKGLRRGTVKIDRWKEIANHLSMVAHAFAKCEHDLRPIASLLFNCYHTAFAHGVVATLHNTRRPKLKTIKYETAPDTQIADLIAKFGADMMVAHPNHHPPVSRNN